MPRRGTQCAEAAAQLLVAELKRQRDGGVGLDCMPVVTSAGMLSTAQLQAIAGGAWSQAATLATIQQYPHSGRRKHLWRLRNDGHRDLLIKHRWGLRGAYAEKTIRGKTYMMTMAAKLDDHVVCWLRLKDDFWAEITSEHQAARGDMRRPYNR